MRANHLPIHTPQFPPNKLHHRRLPIRQAQQATGLAVALLHLAPRPEPIPKEHKTAPRADQH